MFDLQISLNEKDNILYDIGFTYYDLLDSAEQFEIFNSLIKIPFQIIQDIISTNPLDNNEKGLMPLSQSFFKELGEKVSRKISLKKYPYASGVFFKRPEICDEDKILIMFYYTSVKQARMLDLLIPDNTYQGVITIDTNIAYGTTNKICILLQKNGFSPEVATYIQKNEDSYISRTEEGVKLKRSILECPRASVKNEAYAVWNNMPELFGT